MEVVFEQRVEPSTEPPLTSNTRLIDGINEPVDVHQSASLDPPARISSNSNDPSSDSVDQLRSQEEKKELNVGSIAISSPVEPVPSTASTAPLSAERELVPPALRRRPEPIERDTKSNNNNSDKDNDTCDQDEGGDRDKKVISNPFDTFDDPLASKQSTSSSDRGTDSPSPSAQQVGGSAPFDPFTEWGIGGPNTSSQPVISKESPSDSSESHLPASSPSDSNRGMGSPSPPGVSIPFDPISEWGIGGPTTTSQPVISKESPSDSSESHSPASSPSDSNREVVRPPNMPVEKMTDGRTGMELLSDFTDSTQSPRNLLSGGVTSGDLFSDLETMSPSPHSVARPQQHTQLSRSNEVHQPTGQEQEQERGESLTAADSDSLPSPSGVAGKIDSSHPPQPPHDSQVSSSKCDTERESIPATKSPPEFGVSSPLGFASTTDNKTATPDSIEAEVLPQNESSYPLSPVPVDGSLASFLLGKGSQSDDSNGNKNNTITASGGIDVDGNRSGGVSPTLRLLPVTDVGAVSDTSTVDAPSPRKESSSPGGGFIPPQSQPSEPFELQPSSSVASSVAVKDEEKELTISEDHSKVNKISSSSSPSERRPPSSSPSETSLPSGTSGAVSPKVVRSPYESPVSMSSINSDSGSPQSKTHKSDDNSPTRLPATESPGGVESPTRRYSSQSTGSSSRDESESPSPVSLPDSGLKREAHQKIVGDDPMDSDGQSSGSATPRGSQKVKPANSVSSASSTSPVSASGSGGVTYSGVWFLIRHLQRYQIKNNTKYGSSV
eukprot:TRINITY_DN2616_c0_g1_i6.p1 TRINITY_DN2616_c0_g1~~TRINITY_DN2616_c0_g1_i6.p1  ORF type:complete len:813 (+),score=186.65 TRINITY_DN2616_c0_g1_i6:98-2440(+)